MAGVPPLDALMQWLMLMSGRKGMGFIARPEESEQTRRSHSTTRYNWMRTDMDSCSPGLHSKPGLDCTPQQYQPSNELKMFAVLYGITCAVLLVVFYKAIEKAQQHLLSGTFVEMKKIILPGNVVQSKAEVDRNRAAAVARQLRTQIRDRHMIPKLLQMDKSWLAGAGWLASAPAADAAGAPAAKWSGWPERTQEGFAEIMRLVNQGREVKLGVQTRSSHGDDLRDDDIVPIFPLWDIHCDAGGEWKSMSSMKRYMNQPWAEEQGSDDHHWMRVEYKKDLDAQDKVRDFFWTEDERQKFTGEVHELFAQLMDRSTTHTTVELDEASTFPKFPVEHELDKNRDLGLREFEDFIEDEIRDMLQKEGAAEAGHHWRSLFYWDGNIETGASQIWEVINRFLFTKHHVKMICNQSKSSTQTAPLPTHMPARSRLPQCSLIYAARCCQYSTSLMPITAEVSHWTSSIDTCCTSRNVKIHPSVTLTTSFRRTRKIRKT